jgi:hypothetical protein
MRMPLQRCDSDVRGVRLDHLDLPHDGSSRHRRSVADTTDPVDTVTGRPMRDQPAQSSP